MGKTRPVWWGNGKPTPFTFITPWTGIQALELFKEDSLKTYAISNGQLALEITDTPVFIEKLTIVSVEEGQRYTSRAFRLKQNHPNPFSLSTTIEYQLVQSNHVLLRIFDMQGQELHVLVDEEQPVGVYSVVWNGKDSFGDELESGIYFAQLQAKNSVLTKRLLLLK